MRIDNKYKIRKVADQNVVIVQGQINGEKTKVIALNDTSLLLWTELHDRDFTLSDVVEVLLSHFDVQADVATQDAQEWVRIFTENKVII